MIMARSGLMRNHEWGFVRVLSPYGGGRLLEMCWRCGIMTAVDADGTFRMNTKNGQQVLEDCDEVIVRVVHES